MALTHLPLTTPQVLPLAAAAAASVYDNPAGTTTYIKGWRLFNTGTVTELVKIYVVPAVAGPALGAAAAANQVFEYVLQAKESLSEDFPAMGIVLATQHDSIQASAGDATTVNLVLFGDTAV